MSKTKKRRRKLGIRGVSRIDQPEKHNHGFYVRLTARKKHFSKFFSDRKHGGKAKALVAAKKFYAGLRKANPPTDKKKSSPAKRRK
ncbi:MAG: hypothetical protein PHD76_05750 [Methylacidiphilales bacterium]|nr:hypothetical protein [Candidatus Methylacidiphilales bacterium]